MLKKVEKSHFIKVFLLKKFLTGKTTIKRPTGHFIKDFLLKIFLTEKKDTTFSKHAYERPKSRKFQKSQKK